MKPGPEYVLRNLLNSFFAMIIAGYLLFVLFIDLKDLAEKRALGPFASAAAALKKHDTAAARKQFDIAINRNPDDPDVYKLICDICVEANQPQIAESYGERGLLVCIKSDAVSRSQMLEKLSTVYAAAEPTHPQVRAIEAARAAVKFAPNDAMALNTLGYLLADNDESLDEAESDITKSLTLILADKSSGYRNDIFVVYDSYGWVKYKKGEFALAVEALDQAIIDMGDDENPEVKVIYYHLGAALHRSGLTDRARRVLQISLQYDPTFAEAKQELDSLPPLTNSTVSNPTADPSPASINPNGPTNPQPTSLNSNNSNNVANPPIPQKTEGEGAKPSSPVPTGTSSNPDRGAAIAPSVKSSSSKGVPNVSSPDVAHQQDEIRPPVIIRGRVVNPNSIF